MKGNNHNPSNAVKGESAQPIDNNADSKRLRAFKAKKARELIRRGYSVDWEADDTLELEVYIPRNTDTGSPEVRASVAFGEEADPAEGYRGGCIIALDIYVEYIEGVARLPGLLDGSRITVFSYGLYGCEDPVIDMLQEPANAAAARLFEVVEEVLN